MKQLITILFCTGILNMLNAQNTKLAGIASLFKTAPAAALQNIQQAQPIQQASAPTAEKMTDQLSKQSIRFTENKGQVADMDGKLRADILFTAQSKGVKLFITGNGIYYQFSHAIKEKKDKPVNEAIAQLDKPDVSNTEFYRLDMKLVGAGKPTQIIKEGEGSEPREGFKMYLVV